MSLPFLLEIGTEEIPDWMIVPAINQLRDNYQVFLDQNGIDGKVTGAWATPRRLVLRADGLAERQADSEEIVMGPPKSAGAGAAAGFARKLGIAPDRLSVRETPKGEYFSALKKTAGRDAIELLAETLPGIVLKLYFPKTMYWTGKGGPRFIRPIRWILALFGKNVVSFEMAGVWSGNQTHGHRLYGSDGIPCDINNFDQKLKEHGVILSADERRRKIEDETANLLKRTQFRVKPDPELLETLVFITEFPTPILGGFDPEYLKLPREVLSTVMRHHQKYFSVEEVETGSLAPHFIAVMNTDADPEGLVKSGNERVLRARFNDARFFWEMDQKRTLAQRVEDLKHVTFHAKIGSYYEKINRLDQIGISCGYDPILRRAALLCKSDLTTDMVKEFTDLQGIIGGLYARAQGEPEEVALAIYDHYKPLSMEDEIPATSQGCWLSLIDKLDTLRESFKAGLIPSGSKDPFALRRAAQGVIRILAEAKLPFVLNEEPDLQAFLEDRVKFYFKDARGFAYDEVNAAMAAGWNDLPDLESRLSRIQAVRQTPDFEPLAASFKRIKNILKQAAFDGGGAFTESLLEAGPERELYDAVRATAGQPIESKIASLRPKVDLFFDKVLVNAPDPAVRTNRLELLQRLLKEFERIADFSEIVTQSN